MKAYKIYNYRGRDVVYSFIPLQDETMETVELTPAAGFEILEDAYGIPYLSETATGIVYDIGLAVENGRKTLCAQAQKVNALGRLERLDSWRVIAVVA